MKIDYVIDTFEDRLYGSALLKFSEVPRKVKWILYITTAVITTIIILMLIISYRLQSNMLLASVYVLFIPVYFVIFTLLDRSIKGFADVYYDKYKERIVEVVDILKDPIYELYNRKGLDYCLREVEIRCGEPKYSDLHIKPAFKLILSVIAPIFGFMVGLQSEITDKVLLFNLALVVLILVMMVVLIYLVFYRTIENLLNRRYYVVRSFHKFLRDISEEYDEQTDVRDTQEQD